jgi:hypothetical protein
MKKLKKDDKLICPKCKGKGWYFVDEWIGSLQGRKDCKCKKFSLKKI